MSKRLNRELIELTKHGLYPLHMPGHKRNILKAESNDNGSKSFGEVIKGAYDIDITEIDGFDNLHDASELICDAEKRAASLYQSEETHFLVNGSTCGLLSAISAVCNKGDKLIVARNCHISVYNAMMINDIKPVFLHPEIIGKDFIRSGIAGSISKQTVERAILENPDACAVVITSPTYDGVLSDVAGIAKLAHEYDMPLIVDEAHGAMFFIEGRSAVQNNADIVINSVHKTLPALTQTALIHINGNLVNRDEVKKYLRIYQTSSPSYVLMGSIDYAVQLMEEQGKRLYRDYCIRTAALKEELIKLRNLKYITKDALIREGAFDFDESKVLISAGNTVANKHSIISGKDIYKILREKYSFQPEMAAGEYVLLMMTLFDSDEEIERFGKAVIEIDDNIACNCETLNEKHMTVSQKELEERIGKCGDKSKYTVFAYPPGIPMIVEGESVTKEVLLEIEEAINNDLDIKWVK